MALGADNAPMNSTASISIRTARQDDFTALWSVATLDSARVPAEPLLVAERDGDIVAALSLATGESIGDPFKRTADAIELMSLRASQIPHGLEQPHRGLLERLRGRPALAA
jgi:hypothetical protein